MSDTCKGYVYQQWNKFWPCRTTLSATTAQMNVSFIMSKTFEYDWSASRIIMYMCDIWKDYISKWNKFWPSTGTLVKIQNTNKCTDVYFFHILKFWDKEYGGIENLKMLSI